MMAVRPGDSGGDLFSAANAAADSAADAVPVTGVPAIDGIRVGIGGWTYAPWRDHFYPKGLVQRRELEYASRRLSSIEINGTFYAAQKPATYARWAAETPGNFVFSLKAPGRITQGGPLAKSHGAVRAFIGGGLAEFGERLGPILWQLAPRRAFDREDVAAFFDGLPPTLAGRPLKHVIEVRHDSFRDPAFVALAHAYRVATVFTDSAEFPSIADVTGDFIYARLMRSQADIATGYPEEVLDAWVRRARIWAGGGEPDDLPRVQTPTVMADDSGHRREVYLYFISAAKKHNPDAAMTLIRKLGSG
jgi:uncharacterized protein YecE (DUF72 family)